MNKKIIILPLVLSLLVVGCNKKNANKKGDVVNDLVLKANTKEETKYYYSDFNLKSEDYYADSAQNKKVTYSNGFVIVHSDDESKEFYSVVKSKYIAFTTGNSFTTFKSSIAGGYLRITEAGETSIYDALGNKLIDKTKQVISNLDVSDKTLDGGAKYCDIKLDNSHIYYLYNSDGTVTLTATIEGGSSDYQPGSSIQGIEYTSLEEYGHPGYKKFRNSDRYIIFDNNNNEVASFSDPQADAEFFIGDYFIYQNSIKLDENNNNYDYINNAGERYSLETYKINYLTAKKETINVKYVLGTSIEDIHPFFNEKKVYTYCYANLRTISDKKILSNTNETYIIDDKGALHDNVTGIDLGSFVRFGSNYYNTSSKTIYDGNLNEITILADMFPERVINANLIICQIEGKYGAVNDKGVVVIPFEYEKIYSNYVSNDTLLAISNGSLSMIKFNTEKHNILEVKSFDDFISATYLENDAVDGLGAGIYAVRDISNKVRYLSLSGDEPRNVVLDETASAIVRLSSANAIDKVALVVLETSNIGSLVNYQVASIGVTH